VASRVLLLFLVAPLKESGAESPETPAHHARADRFANDVLSQAGVGGGRVGQILVAASWPVLDV